MSSAPPNRQVNDSSVDRLFRKFEITGSVLDQPKPGRNKVPDEVKKRVLAKVAVSPKRSILMISMESVLTYDKVKPN